MLCLLTILALPPIYILYCLDVIMRLNDSDQAITYRLAVNAS